MASSPTSSVVSEKYATIPDLRTAISYFKEVLMENECYITHAIPGTKGPISYRVQDLRMGKEDRVYYVCYNRSHLNAIGRLFNLREDKDSEGQTVHEKILDWSRDHDSRYDQEKVFVVIIMPDKRADTIAVHRWAKYVQVYQTRREIHGERGNMSVSIPVRYMHQFEENEL